LKRILIIIMTGLFVMSLSAGAAWANPGNAQKHKVKKKVNVMQMYKAQYKAMVDGKISVKSNKFKDTANYFGASSVDKMASLGLLAGYADGTFKPNKNVTQAEMVAILMRLVEVTEPKDDIEDEDEDEDEDEEFKKVPGWIKNQAKLATDMGIINLNRFHSAEQASRLQTCVAFAKLLDLDPVDLEGVLPFKDGLLIDKEDLGYILAMYNEELISGMPGGNFNPNHPITRGQMAVIIERILEEHHVDLDTIDDEEFDLTDLESDLLDEYDEIEDVSVDNITLVGNEDEVEVEVEVDPFDDDDWADLSESDIEDWVKDLVNDIYKELSKNTKVSVKILNNNDDVLFEFRKNGSEGILVRYMDDDVDDLANELEDYEFSFDNDEFIITSIVYNEVEDDIEVNLEVSDLDSNIEDNLSIICEKIAGAFQYAADADPEMIYIYVYDEDSDWLMNFQYEVE